MNFCHRYWNVSAPPHYLFVKKVWKTLQTTEDAAIARPKELCLNLTAIRNPFFSFLTLIKNSYKAWLFSYIRSYTNIVLMHFIGNLLTDLSQFPEQQRVLPRKILSQSLWRLSQLFHWKRQANHNFVCKLEIVFSCSPSLESDRRKEMILKNCAIFDYSVKLSSYFRTN